jgi:hypothetical protein
MEEIAIGIGIVKTRTATGCTVGSGAEDNGASSVRLPSPDELRGR